MHAQLEVRTLGPYRLLLAGRPVITLGSRTAEALFIYLMRHKRPLAREAVADFFWDERDTQRAAANLRTILTMLRKSLGDYLLITRRTVAFNHTADYWWDLEALEQEMAALAPVLADPEPPAVEDMQRLDAALALIQGDFLEGFHLSESRGFEEWLSQTQEQVRRRAEDGLQRMVTACLQHREYHIGIDHADRLLLLDPYNEEAHRQMMWLLARSGRRNAALAHYESCRDLLAEEIGAAPEETTVEVYHRIRSLPETPAHRVPSEPTPFVGRAGEAEEIARRLSLPHCRLLTLLGPGGMGKTRLSMQAADRAAARNSGTFLDGIYFVPLANTTSAASFAAAVADALGLAVSGNAEPGELVRNFLHSREILLVLDSVEHLAANDDFVEQIIHILDHAPHVKLLVTSRVRLNLHEEWLYDVEGLDFPSEEPALHAIQTRDAASYAAGALFLQHATRLQRAFQPDPADAEAIARICRLLDGQPLGLELAAAWTRTHSCPEIATQIAHDLDFLNTALRNVPPRQRSLRAVFDYSWSLLTPTEQIAMQRLAVFAGPVDPAVAHAVAPVASKQISALADKSLLRIDQSDYTFAMHDSVRRFTLEKLAAQPALDTETWHAYCRYYAELVAESAPQLHTEAQLDVQAELHRARNNLAAAWDVAVARGWWWAVGQMLDGYYWYLWRRSEMQESRTLLTRAVAALSAVDAPDSLLLAHLQSRLADNLIWLGDYEAGRALIPVAETTLRKLEAWTELAWLYDTQGQLAYSLGNYQAARQAFEDALALFRQEEIAEGVAQTLCAMANVLCDSDADYEGARELYAESLAEYQACGDGYGQAKVTVNLGALAHSLGQYAQAVPYYEEGITYLRVLDHRHTLAIVLNNMGQAQKALGNLDAALPVLEESAELRRELGDRRGLALTLMSLASVAAQEDDFALAWRYCAESLQIGVRLNLPALLGDLLAGVADLLIDAGHFEHAAHLVHVILQENLEGQQLRQKAESTRARLPKQLQSADASESALAQDMAAAANQTLIRLNSPSGFSSGATRADDAPATVQVRPAR